MLKSMRSNQKIIIWIIVFAFIGGTIAMFVIDMFSGNSRKANLAAVINGEEVPMSQYYDVYNRYADFYKQFYNNNFEMAQQLFPVEEIALKQVIKDTIMVQKAKEMGITVRDEEVLDKIKNIPDFQTEGKFDAAKWNQLAKQARPEMLIKLEEGTRKDLYVEKLEQIVKAGVKVLDDEIYAAYSKANEKVKLGFVLIEPKDFVKTDIAKKYYDEHKVEFVEPRQYKARHILIKVSKDASEEDKKKAKEKTEKLYNDVKGGANFMKLAVENSEDEGTKAKGGDLDYFKLGSMVPEFEAAMLKLKEGEFSEPVMSQFGYHIIKLEAIKEEFTKSFDKVEKEAKVKAVTDKEKETSKNKANELLEKFKAGDFIKEASKAGLKFDTTGLFTRNASIPLIGYEKNISDKVFKLNAGEISIEETSKGWYIVKVIDKPKIDNKDYEKESNRFRDSVREEKTRSVLESYYEKLKEKSKIEVYVNIEKKKQDVKPAPIKIKS